MDELERIREVLDGMDLPEWVVRLKPELMYDMDGERAVAVWAVLRDAAFDEPSLGRRVGRFRLDVLHALRGSGIELWPYVRYVAESEAEFVR